MRSLILIVVMVFVAGQAMAGNLSTVKISFKTLACDGTKGFASVDADKLFKVTSSKCEDGDEVGEVYQVLTTGASGYQVFTTSEEEAKQLIKRMDKVQEDKSKSIRDGGRIILSK